MELNSSSILLFLAQAQLKCPQKQYKVIFCKQVLFRGDGSTSS